ncbi:hybrid sensor histidine kinase/response regulator [Argonema antarcticum]|uniref:ATP-binding response regulator n=1 Tax=Argonema antarcticum TaxID=2942763 RepID=UPI00201101D5|nr:hybrid sensor histidine kinase/response regulator [Argonema antarcticum]MCL1469456.1 hybrid sensor histidine kinase/response regulator [Argonema antarcticum A004/B2]
MPTPCLKEFIVTVPICTQMTSLAAVLEILAQGKCEMNPKQICYTDRLVVVSEQQRPLGMLHLSSLLPYLNLSKVTADLDPPQHPAFPGRSVGTLFVGGVEAQTDVNTDTRMNIALNNSSVTSRRPQIATEFNLQQSLSDLGLSVTEPLATLPADFTLKQFWPYLQDQRYKTGAYSDWALVDFSGKFLGLLDSQRLLQYLANHLSVEQLADSEPTQKSAGGYQFEGFDGTNPSNGTVGNNIATPLGAIDPLVELLERLPLPIMLQTGSGQSVKQNLAWRTHFGALQDPEFLRREAAALLEEVAPPSESYKAGEWEHIIPEPLSILDFSVLPNSLPTWEAGNLGFTQISSTDPTSLPKLCHIGTNPNTCICVCPMQNGSERVWQFVKIRLGNVLSNQDILEIEKGTPKDSLHVAHPSGHFRLATLGDTTDSALISHPIPTLENEKLRIQYEAFRIQYEALSTKHSVRSTDQVGGCTDLWLVLAQDVTEEQQVAKELAAKNADLLQLNRLKDEFLACISHELKTPLTAVLGLSSLLKDRLLGPLNDRQLRYTRLIYHSARHLMTVINDILDLTRMETGQLDLTFAIVDIQSVCDRAYEQARKQHSGKNKTEEEEQIDRDLEPNFTLSIESGLDTLIADELRLRQMLVNLLSNALKFTEASGSIGLRVSRWEGWIAFTVWDTGIGIPDEKQHLIFQKFQQLENPLTRQFDGTGLGLVLTQRLTRLHGGDVTFISNQGSGSEFTLLLPPSPPSDRLDTQDEDWEAEEGAREEEQNLSTSPGPKHYPLPHSQSRLVLIVEATPVLIENLTNQLLGLGYRVVIARSGTEALEKARRLQPCTIFLNPLLPLLSGWDVLTLLKASAQTQHIPVIVTATRAEKNYAYSKRADDFLSLPVELDTLRKSLELLAKSAKDSEKGSDKSASLTILRLIADATTDSAQGRSSAENTDNLDRHLTSSPPLSHLSHLLHQYNYRILEADDQEQAELLARIWHPQVVLLDGNITEPLAYLEHLSQYTALANLPLVTLDEKTTEAALKVKGRHESLPLQVFPCLTARGSLLEASTLLQAIQVAAGMTYKRSILVADISMLPDLNERFGSKLEQQTGESTCLQPSGQYEGKPTMPEMAASNKKRAQWLQALIQYLQTAGFKGVLGHSWEEVLQQVQHRSVDLLLIHLGDSIANPALLNELYTLKQFASRPPILVLARRSNEEALASEDINSSPSSRAPSLGSVASSLEFPAVLGEVATRILPASLSMEELLEQIRHALGASPSP